MPSKKLTFFLYDFEIDFLPPDSINKKVSTSLNINDFTIYIYQNCQGQFIYENLSLPNSNLNEYKSLKFLNSEDCFLFGKIQKGVYPYKPDVINTQTFKEESNPRNDYQIEPKTNYFFIKINSVNPINGYVYLEYNTKNIFAELFKIALFQNNNLALHYKDNSNNAINIDTLTDRLEVKLSENINLNILDEIFQAKRIMQITAEIKDPVNNLESQILSARGDDELNNIKREYIISVKRGGNLNVIKSFITNLFRNNIRTIEGNEINNFKIKIQDNNDNYEIININHIQNKFSFSANMADEKRNIVYFDDVYSKLKQKIQ